MVGNKLKIIRQTLTQFESVVKAIKRSTIQIISNNNNKYTNKNN